jgi:hypothetical protein
VAWIEADGKRGWEEHGGCMVSKNETPAPVRERAL